MARKTGLMALSPAGAKGGPGPKPLCVSNFDDGPMTANRFYCLRLFALTLVFALLAGPALSDRLVSHMSRDLGATRPSGCPSKWCACYMDLTLAETGYRTRGSHRARDFASYGQAAKPGSVGSIMVMRNHVGVVAGRCADGRMQIVSGNHSRKVSMGCYSAGKAIAWRAPVR